MLRKLRIAWSVTCGILCLLLIVLWVRSYWWWDLAHCPLQGERMFIVHSIPGRVTVGVQIRNPSLSGLFPIGWGIESIPMKDLVRPRNDPQFDGGWDQYGIHVTFPYWLAVVLSGGVAALVASPWFKWRFSVRTLLIAMTLVAVVLGAIAFSMQ